MESVPYKKKSPESSPLSPPLFHYVRTHWEKGYEEVALTHILNLPAPWSWTSQPKELWEMFVVYKPPRLWHSVIVTWTHLDKPTVQWSLSCCHFAGKVRVVSVPWDQNSSVITHRYGNILSPCFRTEPGVKLEKTSAFILHCLNFKPHPPGLHTDSV